MFGLFALLVTINLSVAESEAKSWQGAIDDVNALAEQYKEAAELTSGESITNFLGTAHAVTDVNMHECAILGRMLGFVDQIGHLEPPQPALDSEPYILADNYSSLSNWGYTAQRFVGMSQNERAKRWNLECVGKMDIPASLSVDVPSEVFIQGGGSYLWVYGDIVKGFSERIREALRQNPNIKNIGIGSGGGSIEEAVKAGYLVRELGISTQLTGECIGACSIFFMGGINRSVFRPYPRLGVHKIAINGDTVPVDDPIYSLVWGYVHEMDVDPNFIVAEMQNWEPNEIGYLTEEQACLSGLVTWYQGGFCSYYLGK